MTWLEKSEPTNPNLYRRVALFDCRRFWLFIQFRAQASITVFDPANSRPLLSLAHVLQPGASRKSVRHCLDWVLPHDSRNPLARISDPEYRHCVPEKNRERDWRPEISRRKAPRSLVAFLCATFRLLWWSGRGSLTTRRFLESGTPTSFRPPPCHWRGSEVD